ncbi:MAG: hypothetical protein ACKOVH_01375, partial [Actinomycetota bacterium]
MTTALDRPASGRRTPRGVALGLVLIGALAVGTAACGGTEPQVRSPARAGGSPAATVAPTQPPAAASPATPGTPTTTAAPAPAPPRAGAAVV